MDDLEPGQVLNDKYRIVATVGRGGMGDVYEAEQLPLGRRVALKVLRGRPDGGEIDPSFKRRFFLEASLCSKLSHPNIITVFDYGELVGHGDSCFIAMEFLDGQTLHARLRHEGAPLSPDDALVIALQIARGLREAHKSGIVHRDLKPANVMLVADEELGERAKIVDFGLVKQLAGHATGHEELTRQGSFLGSPRYMAPEQIEGHEVDARTDLYALGVILYQCLTGRTPFDGDTPMRVFVGHLSHAPPRFEDVSPDLEVPEALEQFVMQLLEKSPTARPESAEVVVHELRALQATLGLRRTLRRGPSPTETAIAAATVRAQIAAGIQPLGSRPSAEPSFSGSLTGTSMERSPSRPVPVAVRRGSRIPAIALGAGALLGATLLLTAVKLMSRPREEARPAAVVATPDASRPHALTIESVPTGAWVRENGVVLGATPLVLSLDSMTASDRTLSVQADGYVPYTLVQPRTRGDVRVRAVLVRTADLAPAQPVTPHDAAVRHRDERIPGLPIRSAR